MEQLTISTGRTYVKGRLNSMGSNTVTMPCATLDLGGQSTAWVLWRDDSRVAVSYQLAAAPNIRLWDKIDLTLWCASCWRCRISNGCWLPGGRAGGALLGKPVRNATRYLELNAGAPAGRNLRMCSC